MEELRSLIRGDIGSTILSVETVDSTNTLAMELGDRGASHGTVVISDHQTKGRGRLGRTWVSPPGTNIYMSVILRSGMGMKQATLLTIMAGVACCSALREVTNLPVKLKWPNDLIVSRKKLGGILTEARSGSGKLFFSVVGVGINVNSKPDDYPPDVREIATTVFHETSREHSRRDIIAALLNEFDSWHGRLLQGAGKPVVEEWRRNSSMLGAAVSVKTGREIVTGTAEDVSDEGMLLLRLPSGQLRTIIAGDLTVLQ